MRNIYLPLVLYIYQTLYINLDSMVCKISLGALIGHVYFTDEVWETGNAVLL